MSTGARREVITLMLSIIAIIVSGAGVIMVGTGVMVASNSLNLTQKIFEYQTQPARLLYEITVQGTSTILSDQTKTYHISKLHADERDTINVSVWNIGHQTAENVTIGIKLDPQDATLYNSSDLKRCIALNCFNYPSNPVKFIAIEPNGFYSMRTTLDLFTTQIKNVNGTVDLVVTISYFDSKNDQVLENRYQIIVD